jgi:DNA-binding LytR/AlgR family response regulator
MVQKMKKLNCLVIDDEPLACKGMIEYISAVEALHCLGALHHPAEALPYLPETELLYLDINMPKISGIDFLKQLRNPPLTILTTAYPQYALEGYELDVVDYLLKPVSFPRFLKATTKAIDYHTLLNRSTKENETPDHFFVKSKGMLEKVQLKEILAIEALANYVIIHTGEKEIIAYLTLKQVKEFLPAGDFLQVHKGYVIARNRISKIDHDILYVDKLQVPVGSNFKEVVANEIAGRILKR